MLKSFFIFLFFLYIASILWVTKKPPKILTDAKIIAKKPNIFAVPNILPDSEVKAAIIAPTMITYEIAFVTDIKGVCRDGVTLQTT